MEPWLIAVISICAVLAVLIIFLFLFAALSYNTVFGKRCDKNPLLKYFTASDFSLCADEFPLGRLYGAIYENNSVPQKNAVIIFAHGMGAGHIAYTTEIAYFCNLGYTVVAVDSLGCGLSQGKNIRGMYEGAKTVIQTVDFAKKQFDGSKIYLLGHSWGGYSVLCASCERKVDKVVAISAPNTPVKTIYGGAANVIPKPLAAILCPFWYLINLFKFGAKGNASASDCAMKNGAPTLLIHGEKDKTVPLRQAACYLAEVKNVKVHLAEGKAHNPYNTIAAEKKLAELSANLARANKMSGQERAEYFGKFDFSAATEEDLSVMQLIADFFE